jgi:RNA polymerase-binding transcription factor DksA
LEREDLDKFREKLESLMRSLSERVKERKEAAREVGRDSKLKGIHLAELGTDEYERERALEVAMKGSLTLDRILRALRKIEEGIYGICEACGEEISKGRLEIIPYAELCARCQEKLERGAGG